MKYRKKPVVIEAIQYTETNVKEIEAFLGYSPNYGVGLDSSGVPLLLLSIKTLEGTISARPGDYIIRGIQGEFYPCKPDIFDQTYEEVVNG